MKTFRPIDAYRFHLNQKFILSNLHKGQGTSICL